MLEALVEVAELVLTVMEAEELEGKVEVVEVLTTVQGLLVLLQEGQEIVLKEQEVLDRLVLSQRLPVQFMHLEDLVVVLVAVEEGRGYIFIQVLPENFPLHLPMFITTDLEEAVEVIRGVMEVIYLYTSVKL